VTTPRREWREFERCVVLIEHEIDVAKETAINGVPSGEYLSLAMLDIFLANGAAPHGGPSVAPPAKGGR